MGKRLGRVLSFQAYPLSQMVAPHTTPLFVSAWRLLPAGGLLVAWGASRGRRHPATPAAWGSIALFALVDATCFQVRPQWRSSQAGLLRSPCSAAQALLVQHCWRPEHCVAADKHNQMRPCIGEFYLEFETRIATVVTRCSLSASLQPHYSHTCVHAHVGAEQGVHLACAAAGEWGGGGGGGQGGAGQGGAGALCQIFKL